MGRTISLNELALAVGPQKVEGSLDRLVQGVAYDSRCVQRNMLFVAVPGFQTDGHAYISGAIDRGACAVICEKNWVVPRRATKIQVHDSRRALARASAVFYGCPSQKMQVIGLTGTSGKTTVAFLLRHILKVAGRKAGLISSIHYEIGERIVPAHRTTPEALDVQQMLNSMLEAGAESCVLEVSSHALEQGRVAEVEFDVAVFTNLASNHLDFHADPEAYYQAKRKLFESVQNGKKRGGAVINIDDAAGRRLARETTAEVQLTYGAHDMARLRATHVHLERDGTRMRLDTPGGAIDCRTSLVGRHNVLNVLAAVGAAECLGISRESIGEALETLPPIPGRFEPVRMGQPFSVFVDYAHTELAMRQVLATVRELTKGRVLLAFGCGGSRDTTRRAGMGKAAAELADFTVITNDNPRRESPAEIAKEVASGYLSVRTSGWTIELERQRAIEMLLRQARPGDTVLIAGKGHETWQEFADTVVPFDDRVHAAEILESMGYMGARHHRGKAFR